ncbi:MAG: mannan-binding lectin, partial [Mycobacterium sp.]|nr:mannan-binding lectin [Mycobacterium sp.]
MRIAGLTTALVVVATALGTTPSASASATSFCTQLGGTCNGQYCHTTVQSDRDAVREISVAIPAELIDDPAVGPVLREYLTTLVGNWRTVGKRMVADSFGEG